jgi:superfamily II DNA or RNA helicase
MDVLTSCEIISEGTDIPVVGAAILLRPTQSMGLYIQQVGRALRPYKGKEFAVILDHVGNCLRHGLPDTLREWTLDGQERKNTGKKSPEVNLRVKQCEKCYAVHAPAPTCPACGFEYPDSGRTIEETEGELRRITEEEAEFMRRAAEVEARLERQKIGFAKSKCVTYADWKALGEQLGYKPGWAGFQYSQNRHRAHR